MDLLPSPGAATGGPDADAATLPGGTLLSGLPQRQQVWMSHGDTCTVAPPGFTVTARTAATPVAAMEAPGRGLYAVQFHPEVRHTEHGMEVLRRFLMAAGCPPDQTMRRSIDAQSAPVTE